MAGAAGVRAIGVSWGYHPAVELTAAGAIAVAEDAAELSGAEGQQRREDLPPADHWSQRVQPP